MTDTRQKYVEATKAQLEQNIFFHSLALEACMGGIYDFLSAEGRLSPNDPPKEDWTLAGLIHDFDYAGDTKDQHPHKTREELAKHGLEVSDSVVQIVKAHSPDLTGVPLTSKADWAIFCADSLTGLITAMAMIIPSKKLSDVKLSSLIKRFHKEPRFAAGTRREEIAQCAKPEGLNIPVEKFIEVCFVSMQKVAGEIGL